MTPLEVILFVSVGLNLVLIWLKNTNTNHRLQELEAKTSTTNDRTIIQENYYKPAERGEAGSLWYVVKEKGMHSDSGTITWATKDSTRISSLQKNEYVRFFMTTVIAHSSDDARKKAESSRKWKELTP